MMNKRKLDGAVDKSSVEQQIHKPDALVRIMCKIWSPIPREARFYGRPANKIQVKLKILMLAVCQN